MKKTKMKERPKQQTLEKDKYNLLKMINRAKRITKILNKHLKRNKIKISKG